MDISYTSAFHERLYTRVPTDAEAIGAAWDQVFAGVPEHDIYRDRWMKARTEKRGPMASGLPWINFPAIDFLERQLSGKGRIFEWGMGGSTVFFRRHARSVVSVEHARSWFEAAQGQIDALPRRAAHFLEPFLPHSRRSQLVLLEPVADAGEQEFVSGARKMEGLSFKPYVQFIDRYPYDFFDLVAVDGRARMACCRRGAAKVKPGGFLMLDNSDYLRYQPELERFHDSLGNRWTRTDFLGPGAFSAVFGWRTTIWQRLH
jgi:hypothetical protein